MEPLTGGTPGATPYPPPATDIWSLLSDVTLPGRDSIVGELRSASFRLRVGARGVATELSRTVIPRGVVAIAVLDSAFFEVVALAQAAVPGDGNASPRTWRGLSSISNRPDRATRPASCTTRKAVAAEPALTTTTVGRSRPARIERVWPEDG